jgi:iron complex transport system permease protein
MLPMTQQAQASRGTRSLVWGAVALLVAIGVSLTSGATNLPLPAVVSALVASVTGGHWGSPDVIVTTIRLPRVLAAVGVGGALSIAGVAFQAVFRNPLAAPDVLGVTSGAGLGAALAIIVGGSAMLIQVSAFAGGVAMVSIVWLVAARLRAGDATLSLVLMGVILGGMAASAIALVKNLADPANALPAITYWLMGSFAGTTLRDALVVLGCAGVAFAILRIAAWQLNLLSLSDLEARALGCDVRHVRRVTVVAATLATSAAVATAGTIAWIGLVVPQALRWRLGSDVRLLLPNAALWGSAATVTVDLIARQVGPAEIAPGVVAALVGGPMFLFLVLRTPWRT